ncbi:Y-family DNA polymerase [Robbsia andropogonis]|uniref:Y-family DNA polymerase n=2 Tax=Robbsia andropogonis TaxID=28092 RepID=UPI002A6B70CE|nr:DNA polymerase Y family protein [Robbsia andropogonis]
MRLWIGVFLPHLPLEVFRPTWSSETRAYCSQPFGASSLASTVLDAPKAPDSPNTRAAPGTPMPLVVLEQGRVVAMSRAAREAGVRLGMKRGGVLTVAEQAVLHDRDLLREADAWQGVALALMQYTPQVALLDWARASRQTMTGDPQRQTSTPMQGQTWGQAGTRIDAPIIVADISASLRLFGGIRALRKRIRATLASSGLTARLSLAPTGTAAALLARAGGATVLHPADLSEKTRLPAGSHRHRTPRTLDRILGPLPLPLLPEARTYVESLNSLGCPTLDDLRRLPRAGVKQRCGEALVDALDRALGMAEEGFEWLTTPERFEQQQALPDRADDTPLILASATMLISRLTGWLAARQWAVTRFTLLLEHERGREARPPTLIDIALADPAWHDSHLLRLVRERLVKTTLDAHVIAVRLHATAVEPATPLSTNLFPEPGGSPADHRRLIELLQARLGVDNVLQCLIREDHRPELANHWGRDETRGVPKHRTKGRADHPDSPDSHGTRSLSEGAPSIVKAGSLSHAARARIARLTPRPVWLLDAPLPLQTRQHRPFYRGSLRLMSPGERIESGWWDDAVVTRDYFVAQAEDHTCYWIFRERFGKKAGMLENKHTEANIETYDGIKTDPQADDHINAALQKPPAQPGQNGSAPKKNPPEEDAHWFLHGFFG